MWCAAAQCSSSQTWRGAAVSVTRPFLNDGDEYKVAQASFPRPFVRSVATRVTDFGVSQNRSGRTTIAMLIITGPNALGPVIIDCYKDVPREASTGAASAGRNSSAARPAASRTGPGHSGEKLCRKEGENWKLKGNKRDRADEQKVEAKQLFAKIEHWMPQNDCAKELIRSIKNKL